MVLKTRSDQSVMVWFGSMGWAVQGLDWHRIGWIGDLTSQPIPCTIQPIFFPLSSKQCRFDAFDHEATSFNNYKSFLFLSPTPAVANPTHRPFPQPRPPLPSLHPVAVGAGSTRPACHRCWGPPPPPTAANPTHRPSPQNKLPLPAPQPRLPLPASRRQCWFCWTHWSPLTILVAVTVTFQFLFFYFNI